MIRVRGLSKEFATFDSGTDGVLALSNIDFEVRDNEFITVIGPSGCGKTTLLRIIAGLIPLMTARSASMADRSPDRVRTAPWYFRTSL